MMRNLLIMGVLLFEALFVQCEPIDSLNRAEPKESISEEILDSDGASTLIQVQKHLEDLEKRLDSVAENPSVPKGFIYVQLPDQPEPFALWSQVRWEEISSKYEGLFFRTVGDASAPFGKIQEDFAPSSRILQYNNFNKNPQLRLDKCFEKSCDLAPNDWSDYIWTGDSTYQAYAANWLRFRSETKTGEVRPKNTAVRIWKRV